MQPLVRSSRLVLTNSYAALRFIRKELHPGRRLQHETGESDVQQHSLWEDLGNHITRADVLYILRPFGCILRRLGFPGASPCDELTCLKERVPTEEPKPPVLAKYGIGIVAYFKLLKFLATLFAAMTVLLLPAFVFFYWGSPYGAGEKAVMIQESSLKGETAATRAHLRCSFKR
jgi:hypothetical protein